MHVLMYVRVRVFREVITATCVYMYMYMCVHVLGIIVVNWDSVFFIFSFTSVWLVCYKHDIPCTCTCVSALLATCMVMYMYMHIHVRTCTCMFHFLSADILMGLIFSWTGTYSTCMYMYMHVVNAKFSA